MRLHVRLPVGFVIMFVMVSVGLSAEASGDRLRAIPLGQAGAPSGIGGAFGIDVGPDGRVYVAIALSSEIAVLDARTGREVDRIGRERGVDGPDDVEVGDDGTVYWTSPIQGTVSALFPDGTFRSQFVAAGLNPITIRDDGRVYVAAAFEARGLFEVDPRLQDPPRALLPEISGLNGFDFGPDGRLYSPDTNTGGVVRIDVDAVPPAVEVVAPAGSFPFPGAVSFDGAGRLHVLEAALGQVFRLDIATGRTLKLLDIEGTLDNLAFDARDRLLVTALADGQVLRGLPFGIVRPLTRGVAGRPGIIGPGGIAVDERGDVFAADLFSLRRLARGRRSLDTFYVSFGPGSIARPATVDVRDGRALITSFGLPANIQMLDASTGEILDDVLNPFLPTNAIFYGDDVAIAQVLTGSVVRASDGSPLAAGFLLPLGLAARGDTLFVSDFLAGTISQTGPDGGPVPVASGLAGPEGLAVFERWLVVAETNADRISAIDLETGESSVLAEVDFGLDAIPTGALPFSGLTSVAVDASRRLLYVGVDRSREVRVFRLGR